MTSAAIPHYAASEILAAVGTVNAVVAFALAVARIVIQTHVNGGYQLLAGPLGGVWTSFFAAAIGIAFACGTLAILKMNRGN